MNVSLKIALDARLCEGARLSNVVNLYGSEVDERAKIGASVGIQRNTSKSCWCGSLNSTSAGGTAGSWSPSRSSRDSDRCLGGTTRPATRWSASTSRMPGRSHRSRPNIKVRSRRPQRSSRGRYLLTQGVAVLEVEDGLLGKGCLRPAPEVGLAKFVNVCGYQIGGSSRSGNHQDVADR